MILFLAVFLRKFRHGVIVRKFFLLFRIDRSFFKIKRISLGYTLPKQLSRKARMENLRIYATVTDPFHWSKSDWMDGYDPEGLARSVVFGVNLTF